MTGFTLPDDGLIAVVKRDCPTCELVAPVLARLARDGGLTVLSQDDPTFPDGASGVVDDTELDGSYALDIEIVPTLIRRHGGAEVGRTYGWDRDAWAKLTGLAALGNDLPPFRPGCGSKTQEPGVMEHLRVRHGDVPMRARTIEVGGFDDPHEQAFERGWSDGLPVIPPTPERVLRMLEGTSRDPDAVVGLVPPNLAPCTVEKVAINAVMAGCRPEYMPVVLAALEAALDPMFTLHGLLCTTCFSGPVIVVNGPVTKRIGMNWGINALGQGNRANLTIGRTLNLIVRNVGGGRPGEIDRACLGAPSKLSFCFAEDETDAEWLPLAQARGIAAGRSAVTLFQGEGIQGILDQQSREPAQLIRSLSQSLLAVTNVKLAEFSNAILVIGPEHWAIFKRAGWRRADIDDALRAALMRPGRNLVAGAQGIGEGIAKSRADEPAVPKFHEGHGLLLVRAGGEAGAFSAIISGWTAGRVKNESQPITREITA